MTRADWILRPVLWFVTASTINVVLHEGAHFLTAFALGLQPTLYQYWVYWNPENATLNQYAAARAAGPTFSLVVGLCCWLAYRAKKQSAAGLPLLYLSAGGVAMFSGNLMSAAFAGDFSGLASWLQLPMTARYAISAAGTVGVMVWLGRQLRQWIPATVGTALGLIGVVVAPVVLGTAIIILINQPVPPCPPFLSDRLSEALLGVFTLLGAARPGAPGISSGGRSFRLQWIDGTIAIAAVLAIRVMVLGITF
jgi:hypothetical protein